MTISGTIKYSLKKTSASIQQTITSVAAAPVKGTNPPLGIYQAPTLCLAQKMCRMKSRPLRIITQLERKENTALRKSTQCDVGYSEKSLWRMRRAKYAPQGNPDGERMRGKGEVLASMWHHQVCQCCFLVAVLVLSQR